MRSTLFRQFVSSLSIVLAEFFLLSNALAAPWDPAAPDYSGHKGKVRTYVQFKQPIPQGFERLALWPAELYDQIAPPKNTQHSPIAK